MDTVQQLHYDLGLALSWGANLEKPPAHFIRLLELFNQEERKLMLQEAYEFYQSVESSGYSLNQFVAYFLVEDNLNQNSLRQGLFQPKDPFEITDLRTIGRVSDNPAFSQTVAATCEGRHSKGLAYVLCNTLIQSYDSMSHYFVDRFARTLEKPIDRPELAAAVSRCLSFNEQLIATFRIEARALTDYAALISIDESADRSDGFEVSGETIDGEREFRYYRDAAHDPMELDALTGRVESYINNEDIASLADLQSSLNKRLNLAEKFQFIESPYGLLVPHRAQTRIKSGFSTLLDSVKRDKSHLLNLSPRGFEEFMGHLFSEIGFEVELTQQTRDGGADIICVRNLNGIPFRLAVELKRYKENRPVSVNLIRSFVGANKQFNANRLVFITTSSYTKPAVDFADTYAKHFLSLKGYDQIREWCNDAGNSTWKLF